MPEQTTIAGAAARTPGRVLLVIDQPVLAEVVKLALNHGRFQHRRGADGGRRRWPRWRSGRPTWPSSTWTSPRATCSTSSATRPPRHRPRASPLVALTRRGDLKTKLAAFERGVDDILTVPFSPEELVARVLAVMRRSYGAAVAFTPTIRLGELEIDILNRHVRAGTSELHLTGLEQSLLYLLAANAGRLLTRDEILDALWGVDFVADSNVVDRHIRNLRIKLQNDWRRPRYIATVPGRGYRFVPTGEDASTTTP